MWEGGEKIVLGQHRGNRMVVDVHVVFAGSGAGLKAQHTYV